jgi:hypothetical protein
MTRILNGTAGLVVRVSIAVALMVFLFAASGIGPGDVAQAEAAKGQKVDKPAKVGDKDRKGGGLRWAGFD